MKHSEVDPDEEHHREILNLQHSQARYESRDFGMSYGNVERKHYSKSMSYPLS